MVPADELPVRRIHIGDILVSATPMVIRTVLGSCVSVCLFDPEHRVGGMNHIFLPGDPIQARHDKSARFGIHAMALLIREIERHGGRRDLLQARVFGGAKTLRTVPAEHAAGARNIEFVDDFLRREALPVVSRDTGGTETRVVDLRTDTGEVVLRRHQAASSAWVAEEERRFERRVREDPASPCVLTFPD